MMPIPNVDKEIADHNCQISKTPTGDITDDHVILTYYKYDEKMMKANNMPQD
jgi:hypothetical protein